MEIFTLRCKDGRKFGMPEYVLPPGIGKAKPVDDDDFIPWMPGAEPKNLLIRIVNRVKDPDKWKHFRENFHTPNQDIIKDYMVNNGTTFEEAMKWAVKQDAMNDPMSNYRETKYANPKIYGASMINNALTKEMNKRALEKAGIKRVN